MLIKYCSNSTVRHQRDRQDGVLHVADDKGGLRYAANPVEDQVDRFAAVNLNLLRTSIFQSDSFGRRL